MGGFIIMGCQTFRFFYSVIFNNSLKNKTDVRILNMVDELQDTLHLIEMKTGIVIAATLFLIIIVALACCSAIIWPYGILKNPWDRELFLSLTPGTFKNFLRNSIRND